MKNLGKALMHKTPSHNTCTHRFGRLSLAAGFAEGQGCGGRRFRRSLGSGCCWFCCGFAAGFAAGMGAFAFAFGLGMGSALYCGSCKQCVLLSVKIVHAIPDVGSSVCISFQHCDRLGTNDRIYACKAMRLAPFVPTRR